MTDAEWTPGQERIRFLEDWEPGHPAFRVARAVSLRGRLQAPGVLHAWTELRRRHDVLRMAFPRVDEAPQPSVEPAPSRAAQRVDLTRLAPETRHREARDLAVRAVGHPLELSSRPPCRLWLLRLDIAEHLLLLVAHRLILDRASLDLLMEEWGRLHDRLADGLPPAYGEPGESHLHRAQRRWRWLREAELRERLERWSRFLDGTTEPLDLPTDRPRPALQTFDGAACSRRLAVGDVERSSLWAAFAAWLHRLTGAPHLCLGMPGRPLETEGVVGPWEDLRVLPIRLAANASWRDLTIQVDNALETMEALGSVPYELLVEELDPDRDPSREPLVQVSIALGSPPMVPKFSGVEARALELPVRAVRLDWALELIRRPDGLEARMSFSTALFDPSTAVRSLDHFERLLEAGLAAPETPVGRLPLLGPGERFQILVEWNDTGAPSPAVGLHERVARQAARTPDAVALVHGDRRLTYGELRRRAVRLAHRLRSLGVGPEVPVGVLLPRGTELGTAILGILEAGGAYLPLDPAYPVRRLAFMLEDSQARLVVTRPELAARLVLGDEVRTVSPHATAGRAEPPLPEPRSHPRHLAYLIYTSGSTGRPKGVAIEHRSAHALLDWAETAFSRAEMDAVLAATSICFDLSVFELFGPWSRGGRAVLAESVLELAELPGAWEVTLVNTVPSALREVLSHGPLPGSVRTVVSAGEVLTRSLVDTVYGRSRVVRVDNLYGPSEDTTYSTGAHVPRLSSKAPTIGCPVSGTRAWVLDGRDEPVPARVPGQLHLTGAGLARGYRGRPRRTAESFVPSPWPRVPGDRMYRTGDLVHWSRTGKLEFLGRLDHQVKIRGFRIELGEVEATLAAHPSVREVVVVAWDGETGSRVVAYVAGEPEGSVRERDLRSHVASRLPEHMVPSRVLVLETLPRTPNGKVDREALPEPRSVAAGDGPRRAPQSPTEELVADAWSEVLEVPAGDLDTQATFFELGGDSLAAMRVLEHLRTASGVRLSIRTVFEASTIAETAERIGRRLGADAETRAVESPPVPRPGAGPEMLSYAQRRVWFLERLEPGLAVYNVPLAYELVGRLRLPALAQALDAILRRHEVLRTRFEKTGEGPRQIVEAVSGLPLRRLDLSGLEPTKRSQVLRRTRAQEAGRPFDLATAPAMRAVVLRLQGDRHELDVTVHHIAFDGASQGVLHGEAQALYRAYADGEPSPLEELRIQFSDYARWERRRFAADGAVAEHETYWRRRLAGAPRDLDLPTDRPRRDRPSRRGGVVRRILSRALAQRLARSSRATLFQVLLTAFATLASRWARAPEVVVGTPVAHRFRPEVRPLIGFLANTLPLRVDLSDDPSMGTLLKRVRQTTLEDFAHQEMPFELVVEACASQRVAGRQPLFQTMLVLEEEQEPLLWAPDLASRPRFTHSGTSKFDLLLSLEPRGDRLEAHLEYSTDLLDATTAARFLASFATALAEMERDVQVRVSRIAVMPAAERHQVVREWNDSVPAGEAHVPVLDHVGRRTADVPDRVAVAFGDLQITYGGLGRCAGRLARRLRETGVGWGDPVGAALPRGPELPAVLLAVTSLGAVWVPLDPSYPRERVRFMTEDTRIDQVLTPQSLTEMLRFEEDEPVGSEGLPAGPSHPEALAYVVYTSGSTGRPKGVGVSHRVVSHLIGWEMTRRHGLGPETVTLQFAPTSFDVSMQEILGTLAAGGRLVLVSEEARRDPRELSRRVAEHQVNRLYLPFVALRQLVRFGEPPASLRRVITAGETLRVDAPMRRWFDRPGLGLENQYGPSETHVVTFHPLVPRPERWSALPPIGRPVPGTRIVVREPGGEPAPLGVSGEICVGGAAVGGGYVRRPRRTAASFRPAPDSPEPGGRLYHTGDVGRFRSAGALEFLGRADRQLKIRGYRVEPGEVESVLAEIEGFRAVAVGPSPDGDQDRLVAWIVPDPQADPLAADALRRMLGERLPDPMIPSAFVELDALPVTPSGKLDRRALPAPAKSKDIRGREDPDTPEERWIASVFADLLGVEAVGRRDDFFALGGHSLLAIRVVSRLGELTGTDFPVRAVFEHPTPAGLAERLAAERARGGVNAVSLKPVPDGPAPVSFAQQRLWFLDRLGTTPAAYHNPAAHDLHGPVRLAALTQAFGEVARRHEPLRTRILEGSEGPIQEVLPMFRLRLPVVDVSPELVDDVLTTVSRRPFELEKGFLWRSLLVVSGPGEATLLTVLHHVISDGRSLDLLHRELGAHHAAFHEGRPSPLEEPAIRARDVAVWERNGLAAGALDDALDFWRRRLQDLPEALELPTDRPRPVRKRYRGTTVRVRGDGALRAEVRRFARGWAATPFMVLASAFFVLLARHASQKDVTMGVPVAHRNRPEMEPLIGFFVNTLVLRARVAPDGSYEELVRKVRDDALSAYAHQDVPFERLVEELDPPRHPGRHPFFDVSFQVLERSPTPLSLPEAEARPRPVDTRAAKFDVEATMFDVGGRYELQLEMDRDLFDPTTAERLGRHYFRLLAAALDASESALRDLPFLSPGEAQMVLREWNELRWETPSGRSLSEIFSEQAAARPAAVAVVCEETHLSYGELRRRARGLARSLRASGVGRGDRVGVRMDRGVELATALLGVLEAGAAYVPLDPEYPEERSRWILDDAEVSTVVDPARISAAGPRAKASEDAWEPSGAGSEDLAYVIYTSGSTGRPKGVLVPHGHVERLFATCRRDFRIGNRDVWTLFHSYAFDFSVWEMWGPWLHGGRLVVVPHWVSRSPEALHDLLGEQRVTVLSQTPSAFDALQRIDGEPGRDGLEALRWVVFGGEALEPTSLRPWFARHGEERPALVNMYGITETTVHVTYQPLLTKHLEAASRIGRALGDLETFVLDDRLCPVPVGIAGEVCVGGAGLAWGYMNRAALTARRFVPHPISDEPGRRLYRSGDLARWRAEGCLEFLGRRDRQVKVRGFRIEPGEIEAALGAHPRISTAVVLLRDDAPGGPGLVAYVVPTGEAPGRAELRAFLRDRLPPSMIPAAFVTLDTLPLTAHGKLDRDELPGPKPETGRGSRSAETSTECLLADVWADLLGWPEGELPGVDDDFFALGGHSLLATRLVSRVRDLFGAELSLARLFERPTLREIAEQIETVRASEQLPEAVTAPVGPASRGATAPLSFSQERQWLLTQIDPGSHAYDILAGLRRDGSASPAALQQALTEVVRRHEILRTTFRLGDGEPIQEVHPPKPVPLPRVDLGGLPLASRRREGERLETRGRCQAFDLEHLPLLLAVWIENRLGLQVHHIVFDGWSLGVLTREVVALHEAYRLGRPSSLPELPIQYADYAVWQRRHLAGQAFETRLQAWASRLEGAREPLDLPTDRPRSGEPAAPGAMVPVALTRKISRQCHALSRRHGVTLFMLLLAAFDTLLHRLTGRGDLAVGTFVAGRRRTEIEPLIGFFVNTLVLYTDVSGDPSFGEVLHRVRRDTLEAFEFQDVPFERLLSILDVERDLDRSPLFQVMFELENFTLASVETRGGAWTPYIVSEGAWSHFDLDLWMWEDGDGGLRGWLQYDDTLFDRSTVLRLAGEFQGLLEAALTAPERPVSTMPLLEPAQAHQLLWEWSHGPGVLREAVPVIDRIFARARAVPHRTALVHHSLHLSFGEMARRAARRAAGLRDRGLGPESVVGVLGDRGPGMITAFLGVLRAGAAYLPLDPAWPRERMRYLLEDAGVDHVMAEPRLRDRLADLADVDVLDAKVGCNTPAPDGDANPEALAYVIYTSGSTGQPKGVGISHRALASFVDGALDRYVVTARDRVLQLASPAFDASVEEIYPVLVQGGTLVFADESIQGSAADFLHAGQEQQLTLLDLPTSFWHQLALALPEAGVGLSASVRLVILGGEKADAARLRDWRDAAGRGHRICNTYGPTETTVVATAVDVDAPPPDSPAWQIPLGRALPGVRAYVLDRRLRPAPHGVGGELCLAGPGLARGYLGRPVRTAVSFVPDPFADGPGERVYRTGDRAVYRPDGALLFLGRLDRQVKIRGFRVEPGEVESALRSLPGVTEAAVWMDETRTGTPVLAGCIEVPTGSPPSWRDHLASRLPSYMMPVSIQVLDELPRTHGGKVDRRALARWAEPSEPSPLEAIPSGEELELRIAGLFGEVLERETIDPLDDFFLDLEGDETQAAEVLTRLAETFGIELDLEQMRPSPSAAELALTLEEINLDRQLREAGSGEPEEVLSPLEKALADVWRNVLDVETVRAGDDFFALGGHSLLATQVVSRIHGALGVELPVRVLFEAPTLGALANRVETQREMAAEEAAPAIHRAPRPRPLPLSFPQQRLWFLEAAFPGGTAYHMPGALRLRGVVRPLRLHQALREILRRHEILRTRFVAAEGTPRQVVDPVPGRGLPVIDLRCLHPEAREREVRRLVDAEARRRFDLEAGPLLRASLVRLARDDHVWMTTTHHAISDARSVDVMTTELSALNALWASGEPSPLEELPIQYGDFAAWQRERWTGADAETLLAAWRRSLADLPGPLELPRDRPARGPDGAPGRGRGCEIRWAADTMTDLEDSARRHGATRFMVLLALFHALLARLSNRSDLLVAVPMTGRNTEAVRGLVGFFVNLLPVRIKAPPHGGFDAWLQATREAVVWAFRHQEVPVERIVAQWPSHRRGPQAPGFRVSFNHLGPSAGRLDLGDVEWRSMDVRDLDEKRELTLTSVDADDGGIALTLSYLADLYEETSIRRWLETLTLWAELAPEDPDRPIEDLPMLGPSRQRQLVAREAPDIPERPPRDPRLEALEAQLLDAFREVTGTREVGRHDDFFELGGSSILAVVLTRRLERELGLHVPVPLVFEYRSVARLGRILSRYNEESDVAVRAANVIS